MFYDHARYNRTMPTNEMLHREAWYRMQKRERRQRRREEREQKQLKRLRLIAEGLQPF